MLEAGVRHDGGDGETGFGLELGGGLHYADPALGFTAETRTRVLATRRHDYEEWRIGGLVRLDPGADGTGLSFSLMPTWGETESGTRHLWEQVVTADEPANRNALDGRVRAEVGYGLAAFDGAGIVTPQMGLSLTDGDREWLAGMRFRMGALDGNFTGALARSASGESDYRVGIALSLPLGGGSAGGSGQPEEQQSRPMSAQPALRLGTSAPAKPEPGMTSSSAAARPAPVPVPGPAAKQPSGLPAPGAGCRPCGRVGRGAFLCAALARAARRVLRRGERGQGKDRARIHARRHPRPCPARARRRQLESRRTRARRHRRCVHRTRNGRRALRGNRGPRAGLLRPRRSGGSRTAEPRTRKGFLPGQLDLRRAAHILGLPSGYRK